MLHQEEATAVNKSVAKQCPPRSRQLPYLDR
jgi:hypothetical protein